MTYAVNTHDSWGILQVGNYPSQEEAKKVFESICQDPWYKSDGTVKGVELVDNSCTSQRLEWFNFK